MVALRRVAVGLVLAAVVLLLPLLGDDAAAQPIVEMDAFAEGRIGAATAFAHDLVFVFGGHDGTQARDDILAYDPVTETYTTRTAKLPAPRHFMGAASDGGDHVYLFGGVRGDTIDLSKGTRTVWRYDVPADRIDVMASLPYDMAAPRAAFAAGNVFLFGDGLCHAACPVWKYDIGADAVVATAATQPGHRFLPAVASDGRHVYYSGGFNRTTGIVYDDIRLFDAASERMTLLAERLAYPAFGHAAAWNGTHVLVTGGMDGHGALRDDVLVHDTGGHTVRPYHDRLPWPAAFHGFEWGQTGFVLHGDATSGSSTHRRANACFDCLPRPEFTCEGGKPPYQRIWINETSTHPWRDLAEWRIDWGDGAVYTLTDRSWIPPVYDYATHGYKHVELTVTDSGGANATASAWCRAWEDLVPAFEPLGDPPGLAGVFACRFLRTPVVAHDPLNDTLEYWVDHETLPPGARFEDNHFFWHPDGAVGDFGPVAFYAKDAAHTIRTTLLLRSVPCVPPDEPSSDDADNDGAQDAGDACPAEDGPDAIEPRCPGDAGGTSAPDGRTGDLEKVEARWHPGRPVPCVMPPTLPQDVRWRHMDLRFSYDPACPVLEFVVFTGDGTTRLSSLRYSGPGNYTFQRLGLTDEATIQLMARPLGAERAWDRTWSVAVATPYGCRDCTADERGAPDLPEARQEPQGDPQDLPAPKDQGIPAPAPLWAIAAALWLLRRPGNR